MRGTRKHANASTTLRVRAIRVVPRATRARTRKRVKEDTLTDANARVRLARYTHKRRVSSTQRGRCTECNSDHVREGASYRPERAHGDDGLCSGRDARIGEDAHAAYVQRPTPPRTRADVAQQSMAGARTRAREDTTRTSYRHATRARTHGPELP